jgi:hypothetical protein
MLVVCAAPSWLHATHLQTQHLHPQATASTNPRYMALQDGACASLHAAVGTHKPAPLNPTLHQEHLPSWAAPASLLLLLLLLLLLHHPELPRNNPYLTPILPAGGGVLPLSPPGVVLRPSARPAAGG